MKQLYRLSAFPKTPLGGNEAGVYLFADSLEDREMQIIAASVGYSETAFVSDSLVADFKLRFFTPTTEVDLCGHATVAAFNLLRDLNIIQPGMFRQETKVGILKVEVLEDKVFMEQSRPIFGPILEIEKMVKCFDNLNFHETLKPQILSTGLKELFLPVRDKSTLDSLIPRKNEIIKLSKEYGIIGIHAFSLDKENDACGRNFAPILGIGEESATGTSNGALACYLYTYHKKKKQYLLGQGYQMKQPSEIISNIYFTDDIIHSVWVGGRAHHIKEKIVTI